MNEYERCAACDYCQQMNDKQGRCLARPPVVFPAPTPDGKGMGALTMWPTVNLSVDWCGEYKKTLIQVASSLRIDK